MRQPRLAIIVGGHGECESVPILIRRIAAEVDASIVPVILPPLRVHEDKLRKPTELERYVELAARKLGRGGGIFVLMDCDWAGACPRYDGPALLGRARAARPDVNVTLVLAYHEYESWFIAAARSIQGRRGLPPDLETVERPEEIRGAKEWLRTRMPKNRRYTETEDQPALTAAFDMGEARRAPFFEKCLREIKWLLSVS